MVREPYYATRSRITATAFQPEDSPVEENEEAESACDSTWGPALHTRTKKQGLALHLEKQLLQEIEEAGGLFAVSLKDICDEKPDDYGRPASPRRAQIQDRVQYLKTRLQAPEYLAWLEHLGVTPSHELAKKKHHVEKRTKQAPRRMLGMASVGGTVVG